MNILSFALTNLLSHFLSDKHFPLIFFLTLALHREEQAEWSSVPDVNAKYGGPVRLRPSRELP